MKKFSTIIKIFGILWIAVVFYFAGYLVGHKNLVFEKNFQPKLTNTELKKSQVDFSTFQRAWDTIASKYPDNYSAQKLINGAISGMVQALGDPYSSFMESSENQKLMDDLSGEFEGIGAELSKKDNKLTVIAPLAGSPAEKAGIKAKDEILAIDGQDTTPMTLEQAVDKIRGKAGTSVTLTINREGFAAPREFKISREKITVKSVEWEMLASPGVAGGKGDIGYIKISKFGGDTSALAKQAAQELAQKNPKAIVLDLRNNPGGYLDAAVDVASLFVKPGQTIVKEQYKDGSKEELKTTLEDILSKYKTVVLVNGGSASASEIVAGALQDINGSILVGEKTFGKGTVQELEDLGNNSYLRLTIAKWLTPKDRTINKDGLKVDIEVPLTDQDEANGLDPQLDKAIQKAEGN